MQPKLYKLFNESKDFMDVSMTKLVDLGNCERQSYLAILFQL